MLKEESKKLFCKQDLFRKLKKCTRVVNRLLYIKSLSDNVCNFMNYCFINQLSFGEQKKNRVHSL